MYLKGDINYFSRSSSLVIISLKDTEGNGGNVYVNPEVTNIDATIIADGALMNGALESGNIVPKVWFNDNKSELSNPLTINGRLLTYNTRGGSLVQVSSNGLDILEKNTGVGQCISNKTITTCSNIDTAALQDLERFRVVMRVPDDLNNRCTLHVTGVMALNRPDILTRVGF